MDIKNFYKGKKLAFIIIVTLLVLGYFILHQLPVKNIVKPTQETETTNQELDTLLVPMGEPVFTWGFQYKEDGDYPKTIITLSAQYENGVSLKKDIDTPEGSCNTYSDQDKDVYKNSEMIICYAAGLGYYYKVVQSDALYLVQRKTFEEGSPDYNPPMLPFETIEQF